MCNWLRSASTFCISKHCSSSCAVRVLCASVSGCIVQVHPLWACACAVQLGACVHKHCLCNALWITVKSLCVLETSIWPWTCPKSFTYIYLYRVSYSSCISEGSQLGFTSGLPARTTKSSFGRWSCGPGRTHPNLATKNINNRTKLEWAINRKGRRSKFYNRLLIKKGITRWSWAKRNKIKKRCKKHRLKHDA